MKFVIAIACVVWGRLCLCADSTSVVPRRVLGVVVVARASESVRASDSKLRDDLGVIPIGSAMVVYEHWAAQGWNLGIRLGLGYDRFRTRWSASDEHVPMGYYYWLQSDYEFATVSAACIFLPVHVGFNLSLPISTRTSYASSGQPRGAIVVEQGWSQVSLVAGARYALIHNKFFPADLLFQTAYGWGARDPEGQLLSVSLGVQVLFPI